MRSFSVLVLFVLVCQFGTAQTVVTSGTVRGVVSDETGAVVAGASVRLAGGGRSSSTRVSNSVGIFLFPALPVGSYVIEVSAAGFREEIIQAVLVQVGETTSVNVKLQPGASADSVTVSAESPLLRAEDSDQSSVVNRGQLDDLPLNGRRFLDLALLIPNVTPDGQNGLVSFAGEDGGQDAGYANANGANSFTVDGANATSNYFGNARGGEKVPYIFGENAIEEFQAAVSPYRAEYGGGSTGFINVVTRSGGDAVHGNAFYYNRNSATGANDAVDKANHLPRPVDLLQQFGGSVGGPVVKRRAWYFLDYEEQDQKNPITAVNGGFAGVDQAAFGIPDSTLLPSPNGSFPVPSSLAAPDQNNPVYQQDVANALHAIDSNLGVQSRFRNDWSLFSKFDYRDLKDDRFFMNFNWNRFDSPNGFILGSQSSLFGKSALANAYVRDHHASMGWSRARGSNLLNELHASFSRDDQYSTPTGLVNPALPTALLVAPDGGTNLQLGNAGFAGGRTDEALWQLSDHVTYLRGKHTFEFGVEFADTHVTDLAFGGFDPDAQAQNGTFRGTYTFSPSAATCNENGTATPCPLSAFALGMYSNFFQSTGQPKFSFHVPYAGFHFQDTYQVRSNLIIDVGLREDFQVYPQPNENPAFPLTGQFPKQYKRLAPRAGFSWQTTNKTVVRGGVGMFYENLNGLNYRNAVVSNGLLSQQASVSLAYDPTVAPDQQIAVFPRQITDPSQFSAPDISLVDPHFRFPYILESSLQIEREVARNTVITVGTGWTHGVHLISSSAYDLNLNRPTGTATYILCPPGVTDLNACNGRAVVLPNLDSGLQTEGRLTAKLGQINALISPGINNYNSLFLQARRQFVGGVAFQAAYTLAKNLMSNGVDFNDQFDFRNTHSPYLIDQRHRLSIAGVYAPNAGAHLRSKFWREAASNWRASTVMQFASGRPYAALLDVGALPNSVNNTAALQATANSALGINGGSPSPFVGLNSFYGPWTEQVDLDLSRHFNLTERQEITLQAQVFNLANHANYYVQDGTGVNPLLYSAFGPTCGDGVSKNQTCYLTPNTGVGGFGTLQQINALNGPRIFQFAFKYSF